MKSLTDQKKQQGAKEKKRFVSPSLSLSMSFKRQNNLLHIFLHGKWHGKKTQMAQKYIYRRDGSLLRVLVVWSNEGSEKNATGLLWLHGGGFDSDTSKWHPGMQLLSVSTTVSTSLVPRPLCHQSRLQILG